MKSLHLLSALALFCLCGTLLAQTVHTGVWTDGFGYAADNNTRIPLGTRFKVDFDAKNLYITVECMATGMDQIKKQPKGKKRQWPRLDGIEIFLDPGRSCGKYFQLAVGANGAMYDSRCKKVWKDYYTANVKLYDDKWTVRFAIPINTPMMQKAHLGDRWGFNVCRNVKTGGDYYSTWAKVGAFFHSPAKFATLIFGSKNQADQAMRKKNMADLKKLEKDLQKMGLYARYAKQIAKMKKGNFSQLDMRDIREEAAVDKMLEKVK